jgi:hypothetical protein
MLLKFIGVAIIVVVCVLVVGYSLIHFIAWLESFFYNW